MGAEGVVVVEVGAEVDLLVEVWTPNNQLEEVEVVDLLVEKMIE